MKIIFIILVSILTGCSVSEKHYLFAPRSAVHDLTLEKSLNTP